MAECECRKEATWLFRLPEGEWMKAEQRGKGSSLAVCDDHLVEHLARWVDRDAPEFRQLTLRVRHLPNEETEDERELRAEWDKKHGYVSSDTYKCDGCGRIEPRGWAGWWFYVPMLFCEDCKVKRHGGKNRSDIQTSVLTGTWAHTHTTFQVAVAWSRALVTCPGCGQHERPVDRDCPIALDGGNPGGQGWLPYSQEHGCGFWWGPVAWLTQVLGDDDDPDEVLAELAGIVATDYDSEIKQTVC